MTKLSFSLNKPNIPVPIEKECRGKEYIMWGEDNLYPQYLYNLYLQSASHQTICKGVTEYIFGKGITSDIQLDKVINIYDDTTIDIIKKAVDDYIIFGGFAIQVIFTEDGTSIAELYNLELENCRVDEDITKLFYSEKWGQWGSKAIEYDILNNKNRYGSKVFYYKGNKARGVYPLPSYIGAIRDIETSIKISEFHLNNINNNFCASAIVSFNNGTPEQDIQDQIVEDITDIYTGSDNAGSVMVTFNNSKENSVEVSRLQSDDFDKKFETLKTSIEQNIFTAHRITSPALFGVKMENTGFSSTEFNEAFNIFQATVVEYAQTEIENAIKKLLKAPIKFIKFSITNDTPEQPAGEPSDSNPV